MFIIKSVEESETYIYLLTYSLTHSLIHSLTHSLTHSLHGAESFLSS